MIPRKSAFLVAGLMGALIALAAGGRFAVHAQGGATSERMSALEQAELLKQGRELYVQNCAGCHGLKGDGHGPAARWLNPKPRDFRDGVYKFRSTPAGALPTDGDLMRTLTAGVIGTSMPSWHLVPDRHRYALVQYIKTFSASFEDVSMSEPPIHLSPPPEDLMSPQRVYEGRLVYEKMACNQCHGDTGLGDGPSANALDDQWGFRLKPANFVHGKLRGGDTPVDIYRTFTTGLNGTPMPAYRDDLTEDERWSLVAYIRALRDGADPHPPAPEAAE